MTVAAERGPGISQKTNAVKDWWRGFQRSGNIAHLFALLIMISVVFGAIFSDWVTPFGPNEQNLRQVLEPPFSTTGQGRFFLGTDYLGRDVYSRLVYGARVSLLVGFVSVALAGSIGTILGVAAGYFGGLLDLIVVFAVDMQLSVPFFVLAITAAAILSPGLWNVIAALVIASWPRYARIARSQALSLRERQFVEASRSLGSSNPWIIRKHIFPNTLSLLITISTVEVARMILAESALSFLGLGMPSHIPSWGLMTADGRDVLAVAWWVATMPGLAILAVTISITLLGDLLRERSQR